MKEREPSYYAQIPASVRYDKQLQPNAKLLYGELTALSNKEGYCWASNAYFAKLYGVNKGTISHWVTALEHKGFIRVVVETDAAKGKARKIYIADPLLARMKEAEQDVDNMAEQTVTEAPEAEQALDATTPTGEEGIYEIVHTPSIRNDTEGIYENVHTPIRNDTEGIYENVQYNNTVNSTINSTMKKRRGDKQNLSPDGEAYRLAEFLWKKIRERYPTVTPPNLERWAVHTDKMLRLDGADHKGRTAHDIAVIINYSQQDPFWRRVILSTENLRDKFDKIAVKREEELHGNNGTGHEPPAALDAEKYRRMLANPPVRADRLGRVS